jgi:hypothetical protein
MDETRFIAIAENKIIYVVFDVRAEERCFKGLKFSEDDARAICLMSALRKVTQPLPSVSGTASFGSKNTTNRDICISFKNGTSGTGTVYYSYDKLCALLNRALAEIYAA